MRAESHVYYSYNGSLLQKRARIERLRLCAAPSDLLASASDVVVGRCAEHHHDEASALEDGPEGDTFAVRVVRRIEDNDHSDPYDDSAAGIDKSTGSGRKCLRVDEGGPVEEGNRDEVEELESSDEWVMEHHVE